MLQALVQQPIAFGPTPTFSPEEAPSTTRLKTVSGKHLILFMVAELLDSQGSEGWFVFGCCSGHQILKLTFAGLGVQG